MKKFLLPLLGILSVGFVFTACDDDDEYVVGPESEGIYFPTSTPTAITLQKADTSYDLTLARTDTKEAATYPLKLQVLKAPAGVSDLSGKFSVPAEVSFAAGQKEAIVPLTFAFDKIGYGDYTVKVAIPASEAYQYGSSTVQFTIGIPEPYVKIGTALINETFMWGLTNAKADMYQNSEQPNKYRLMDPFNVLAQYDKKGERSEYMDLVICEGGEPYYGTTALPGMVYWTYALSGYYNDNYPQACIEIDNPGMFTAYNDDQKTLAYNTVLEWADDAKTKPGLVALSPYYYIEGVGGWNKATAMSFQITFPGYEVLDNTVDIEYLGIFNGADESAAIVANVTLGADVTSALVACRKDMSADDVLAGLRDGSIVGIEITESGKVTFPVEEDGDYVVAAISTNKNGKPADDAFANISYSTGPKEWNKLGMATYTDGFMCSLYSETPAADAQKGTYQVELAENIATPGVYRLKNPYGASFPFNNEGDYDATKNYFLVINASDPDGVYIELQPQGINWGDGEMSAWSYADYFMQQGYTLDVVKGAGYAGKLENGTITFPVQGLLALLGEDGPYYANQEGEFLLVLPEAAAARAPKAKARSYAAMSSKNLLARPATLGKYIFGQPRGGKFERITR